MEESIEFERCIEFLVRMIEKYGDVIIKEYISVEEIENNGNLSE